MNKRIHLLLFLFSIANMGHGQSLDAEQIDIVKPYKPMLSDAVKLKIFPTVSEEKFKPQKYTYQTNPRLLNLPYEAPSIPPAAIGKEDVISKFQKYCFKGGYGIKQNSLLHFCYNNSKNRFKYGASFDHLAMNRRKLDHQAFSDNNVTLNGQYFLDKVTVTGQATYDRNVVHYYGYDRSIETYGRDQVKQRFNNYQAKLNLRNSKQNFWGINHRSKISFYRKNDLYGASESHLNVDVFATKQILPFDSTLKHQVDLNIGHDYITTTDSATLSRVLIKIFPKYRLTYKGWEFKIGANSTLLSGGYYLLPDISWYSAIIPNKLYSYAGWTENLQINTFHSYTTNNAFLSTNYLTQYMELPSRVIDKYTGFKGKVGKKIEFDVKFAHKSVTRLPLFVNDTTDTKKFDIVFDPKTIILNVHAELGYYVIEKFQLWLGMDYMDFTLSNEAFAWHLPNIRLNISAKYHIQHKIFLTGELFVYDGLYAKLPSNNFDRLNTAADFNIAIDYQYSDNLGFFLNLNNAASVQWQRLNNYPTYGLNGNLGVTLKF